MGYKETYNRWLTSDVVDDDTKAELKSIENNEKEIEENKIKPVLIIAVPVGFVNVVEAKEIISKCNVPVIVARGRKGGSNLAAAICNGILYGIE